MSLHEKTLKLVMNLDRGAIEARLADVRKLARLALRACLATQLRRVRLHPLKQRLDRPLGGALVLGEQRLAKARAKRLDALAAAGPATAERS